jgi:hypothetical protein
MRTPKARWCFSGSISKARCVKPLRVVERL